MKFRATLELAGKTATGIRIPAEVVEALGAGKQPSVRVTIRGFTYRSTVAKRGERYLVGVSAENRAGAGVQAGDEVDVDIEVDTSPREVNVPADFAKALDDAGVRRNFDESSFTRRKEFVRGIEEAKRPETRERRIAKAISTLREG